MTQNSRDISQTTGQTKTSAVQTSYLSETSKIKPNIKIKFLTLKTNLLIYRFFKGYQVEIDVAVEQAVSFFG